MIRRRGLRSDRCDGIAETPNDVMLLSCDDLLVRLQDLCNSRFIQRLERADIDDGRIDAFLLQSLHCLQRFLHLQPGREDRDILSLVQDADLREVKFGIRRIYILYAGSAKSIGRAHV